MFCFSSQRFPLVSHSLHVSRELSSVILAFCSSCLLNLASCPLLIYIDSPLLLYAFPLSSHCISRALIFPSWPLSQLLTLLSLFPSVFPPHRRSLQLDLPQSLHLSPSVVCFLFFLFHTWLFSSCPISSSTCLPASLLTSLFSSFSISFLHPVLLLPILPLPLFLLLLPSSSPHPHCLYYRPLHPPAPPTSSSSS